MGSVYIPGYVTGMDGFPDWVCLCEILMRYLDASTKACAWNRKHELCACSECWLCVHTCGVIVPCYEVCMEYLREAKVTPS